MGAVERFYQLAVLGLVASGYAGVALTGYLDHPTVIFMGLALLARALQIFGVIRLVLPARLVEICALACIIYYPIDYLFLSRDFLLATVHMIIILAVLKILSARTQRDHFYALSIAFLELLAAAVLSTGISFFLVLAIFLCCLIAALTSGEIRRAAPKPQDKSQIVAQTGRVSIAPRLALLAFFVTAGILTITAGLFFLAPRTASAVMRGFARPSYHLSGFTNQVRLGEVGELQLDSRTIMRVKPYEGVQLPPGLKWRGLTLSHFDGRTWTASFRSEELPIQRGVVRVASDEERLRNGPAVLYRVDLSPVDSEALFIAGLPEFLNVGPASHLFRMNGGVYRLGSVPSDAIRYEVSSAIASPFAPGPTLLDPEERAQYLQLPPLDPRIPELARQMMGDGNILQRVWALQQHLRRDYTYSLKMPSVQPADPLADFLFKRKQGYCEYFASSMAVMLRSQGIPARVVNGFAGGAYNPVSDLYMIRASDAHSWVEAYIEGAGPRGNNPPAWMTFDPTPSVPAPNTPSLLTTIGYYLDAADTFWQEWVLNYDLAQQFVLGASIELGLHNVTWLWHPRTAHLPAVSRQMVTSYIVPAILLIIAIVMIVLFGRSWAESFRSAWHFRRIRQGSARPGDAAILYDRLLRIMNKRGYQKPGWFTPREFAATVRLDVVDEFTECYNALRYGGDATAAERMKSILRELA